MFRRGVLKVDSFINHQMDPTLMKAMAVEFVRRFANEPFNKILTIEASGIAPAIMVGFLMDLPVVFAKETAQDYGKYALDPCIFFYKRSRLRYLSESRFSHSNDRVLFIDDFWPMAMPHWEQLI